MTGNLLTFTNLFPSAAMPLHGSFVRERMQRVVARGGYGWQVVAPVPLAPWILRSGTYRRWAGVPAVETEFGCAVHHPGYRHWPGLSGIRQADAMAAAALPVVRTVCAGGAWVLDAHYLWPDGVAAAAIARELGLPLVLTARGSDLNVAAADPRIRARIRAAASGAAQLVAVSSDLCDRFAEVAAVPRDRVLEVRNGVDLDRFRPGDARAARLELGLPEQGTLVLGVGRLVPGKGFDVALEAVRSLAPARLVLVGDGPERRSLEAAGNGSLILLGEQPRDRVALAMRACDVLVLPSEREGWPNVVTEALASGLRVVASRVGGIPEVLGHPAAGDMRLGALVPPRDPDSLAAALGAVLAAPVDLGHVRAHAQQWSWDGPVDALCRVFDRLLAGGRS
ncbi:MAG: hypothetical protein RL148_374 [Planctomycetota bacterium]